MPQHCATAFAAIQFADYLDGFWDRLDEQSTSSTRLSQEPWLTKQFRAASWATCWFHLAPDDIICKDVDDIRFLAELLFRGPVNSCQRVQMCNE